MKVNEHEISNGDGAAISELELISIEAVRSTEFLLFDLK